MRLCKDQLTGEKKPQNELYKAENGKYYTSKEKYDEYIKNNKYKDKCTAAIFNMLQYKEHMKLPTLWYKKLAEWKGYGYEVVFETIIKQEGSISWAIENKQFTSEVAKIMYVSAIINNNLTDTLKEINRKRNIVRKDNNNEILVDIKNINRQQKVKNISSFLED